MKSGFERIGRTVTVETAQRGCFGKVRYEPKTVEDEAHNVVPTLYEIGIWPLSPTM